MVKSLNHSIFCPLLKSDCAKMNCLFWTGELENLGWKDKNGCCSILLFHRFFFQESGKDSNALRKERTHIFARALAKVDFSFISDVFQAFPEGLRCEVLFWLLSLCYPKYMEVDPERKRYYNDILRPAVEREGKPVQEIIHGRLYNLLWDFPLEKRLDFLKYIRRHDLSIYKDMEDKFCWLKFDDLSRLSGRELKALLQKVEDEDLLLALKICGDGLKRKLFANMEGERAQTLAEDLECMGPVMIKDIEKSQNKIINIVSVVLKKTVTVHGSGFRVENRQTRQCKGKVFF